MIGQKGIPAIFGGIERHVEELSLELAKQGHEVLVYARKWYAPSPINVPGIRTIFTPTIHTKHLDAIAHTFTSTIHALFQKPDVIHYHGVGPSLLAWIPRLFSPRTKVVATFHCIDRYHQKWGALARFFLRLGEKAACTFPHETIAVSKTIQSYCVNEYHRQPTYIPNGIIMPEKVGTDWLPTWKLEPNKYLLMVSRLVKHKGAHLLIEAWQFARLQYPNQLKDYKLVIVGGASFTDDYVAELHRIAKSDPSIVFTDWQSNKPLAELYANASMLIHPSENEGLPITVLQAMSYARPVLVSDIPEHREIIIDQRFWFANGSVGALADKLIELLGLPELLKEAGEKNKRLAAKDYGWKDIVKKTVQLYSADAQHKTLPELTIALKKSS